LLSSTLTVLKMPFHNISKNLGLKPDDKCVSPFGQTVRGQAVRNFVLATWPKNRRGGILYFSSIKPLFFYWNLCKSRLSKTIIFNWKPCKPRQCLGLIVQW
jgi:hypothetical protein